MLERPQLAGLEIDAVQSARTSRTAEIFLMKAVIFVLFALFNAAIAYSHELLIFESEANGAVEITMTFFEDKTFVIRGAFHEQDEETGGPSKNLGDPFEFNGRFIEGENTYDLEFRTLGPGKPRPVSEETIKELIENSKDLWFIPSTKKVRMSKNPKDLRLYGTLMKPKIDR